MSWKTTKLLLYYGILCVVGVTWAISGRPPLEMVAPLIALTWVVFCEDDIRSVKG